MSARLRAGRIRRVKYFRTDEINEFIGALEHCSELAASIVDDTTRWKWLVLALHNALQGACVCALRGRDTSGIAVLTKDSAAAVWKWLENGRHTQPCPPIPREKLAPMVALYQRVQQAEYLNEPHRLPPNPQHDRNVRALNKLRNEWSHFVLHGWSVEIIGLPGICESCFEIIEYLSLTHSTFGHQLKKVHRNRITSALRSLRGAVVNCKKAYSNGTE